MKANHVFVWHNSSEVPEVYQSFVETFAGLKGDLPIKLYTPDEEDYLSITRDDIIPNAISRSHSVIMLLSGKENVEEADFVRVIENIAFSPRRLVISPVFLRPSAKEWWRNNVEVKIESLRNQCVEPIEIWSNDEPAVLTGSERNSACVRRIEDLRRRIQTKVRELETTASTISAPEWADARGRDIVILSAAPECSELQNELMNAFIILPTERRVTPIIWPKSQELVRNLLKQPVLFVRIVVGTKYVPLTDADFRREIRAALGLDKIDFGPFWEAITKSFRLDWAPKAPKSRPPECPPPEATDVSTISTSIVCTGISSIEVASEIGRYLGVVKPSPPLVGYITIILNPDRSSLVPNAQAFESNVKRGLSDALTEALQNRVHPAEPDLQPYHMDGYEVMIEKEISSGRVPIILADDLASSAQKPDIVEVLKLWEARIRTVSKKPSKTKNIIRGALIYFNAEEYKAVAQFRNDELKFWFPLVVDGEGNIAANQLRAMTSAVSNAFPNPTLPYRI
jgi:hypothetical protein